MSVMLMTEAFKSAIQSTHKFVLVALCDNANDQGECYPSLSTLCEKTSLSDRTVQKSLAWLEETGFIQRRERSGRSNYFYIADPRTWFTPEEYSPPNVVHPTPERGSPHPRILDTPPPNVGHPTPELGTGITIIEPSMNRQVNRVAEKRQRGTAMSPDWRLPNEYAQWALTEYPQWSSKGVQQVGEKFRDYWLSGGGVKKDWFATWRNWCRNEQRMWSGRGVAAKPEKFNPVAYVNQHRRNS